MDADDLALCLQHLGFSADNFGALVDEDGDRVARWLSGAERAPRTIDLLTFCWCEFPATLELARQTASGEAGRTVESAHAEAAA